MYIFLYFYWQFIYPLPSLVPHPNHFPTSEPDSYYNPTPEPDTKLTQILNPTPISLPIRTVAHM